MKVFLALMLFCTASLAQTTASTYTYPGRCRTTLLDGGTPNQATAVGTVARYVPGTATGLADAGYTLTCTANSNRLYAVICNDKQNTSTTYVKCRPDGIAPVMALGNKGDTLANGDCITYAKNPTKSAQCVYCISTVDTDGGTADTIVDSFECLQ